MDRNKYCTWVLTFGVPRGYITTMAETLQDAYSDTLTIRLRTRYPCCNGRCIINATRHVPREQYTRTCPRCGQLWEVERRTAREDRGELAAGLVRRTDIIEWTQEEP